MIDVDVILFDWGGTLSQVVGQDEALARAAARAAEMTDGVADRAAIDRLLGMLLAAEGQAAADPELREADMAVTFARWAETLGRPVPPGWVEAAVNALSRTWIGSLEPLPGTVEAVRTLRGRGYRMGLVSNCMLPPACSNEELARHGFGDLLHFAVFSSGVGYRKPSPRIYEAALARAFPDSRPRDLSRVLFVGDSPVFDVAVPASMGMKTALVRCYRGIWPVRDYEKANPDLRIDSVAELPGLLRA